MSRCACLAWTIVVAGVVAGVVTVPAFAAPDDAPAPATKPAAKPDTWAAPATTSMVAATCEQLPFAASTPVPEASGAAWLTVDGKPALLVISDSGHDGAYGILDPETGATIESGRLPLGTAAGDDLEGVAVRGDTIYGLISSGWMRVWKRKGKGFVAVGAPYAIGPVRLADGTGAAAVDAMVCDAKRVNCGRNYEGLCLAPPPAKVKAKPAKDAPAPCVGFAASKADGQLYCLTDEAGKLVVHRDRAIGVTGPNALADCAFADDGTLWTGNNMFDLGRVYRITGWEAPATAKVESLGSLGVGFPEGIAARGDIVYRLSDMGGAPSLLARYRCTR